MLAGIAAGMVDRDAGWIRVADTVEPNQENRETYDELYAFYRDLYPATHPMAQVLASIQTRGSDPPEVAAP